MPTPMSSTLNFRRQSRQRRRGEETVRSARDRQGMQAGQRDRARRKRTKEGKGGALDTACAWQTAPRATAINSTWSAWQNKSASQQVHAAAGVRRQSPFRCDCDARQADAGRMEGRTISRNVAPVVDMDKSTGSQARALNLLETENLVSLYISRHKQRIAFSANILNPDQK